MLRIPTIILSGLLLTVSAHTYAEVYSVAGSGTTVASQAADTNADLTGGAVSNSVTRGSGITHVTGRSDLLPWDGFTFCDFDPATGIPRGVQLAYASLSNVDIADNGDMLFRVLDTAPPSTLCFNFVDGQSFTFEINSVIVGGTGRWEGATGNVKGTGSGRVVVEGHSAFSFEFEGFINR